MLTRQTVSEQFAASHRRDTSSYVHGVSTEKAAPLFQLGGSGSSSNFMLNFSSSTNADLIAYNQFKRWTYVAISAIARRMSGFEFCAASIKNAAENQVRGVKSYQWRERRRGENFRRRLLSPVQVAALPMSVRRLLGGTLKTPASDIEVLDQHDVLDILQKPNHVQKKQEFIFNIVANLYLTGESWLIGGESDGRITIWAIPSHWVIPEHNGGLFTGYRLQAYGSGSGVEVPAGGITRMYFPDPSDPTKVISPVHANIQAILTDESLQTAHKQSFDQGIFPKIAISIGPNIDHTGKPLKTKPVLDADQREQLMSAVQSVWMAGAGDGLPAILDGLIDDIKPLQTSPVEMDYLNSSELIKSRIFQAFGLNPIIVGEITASNKAQALVAERNFSRNVLQPIADTIGTTLTDWVGPWFDKPKRLVVYMDKDEPADEDLTVKKWQHAVDSDLVSEDEYRVEMLGLDPMTDEEKAADRSKMLDSPQVWNQVQLTVQAIGVGKLSYDAGVAQVVAFCRVSEDQARKMLGKEPTQEEIDANIEANKPPVLPAGDQLPPADEPDDEDEPVDEEADDADESEDESGKSKKKRTKMSAFTKF